MFRLILIFFDEINVSHTETVGCFWGKTLSERGEALKQIKISVQRHENKKQRIKWVNRDGCHGREIVLSPALHSALKSHHSQTAPK